MADRTLFFDELLSMPNLRAKSYVIHDDTGRGMACIELTARRLEDWFFARRWVATRNGRRLLFWLLDEVEGHGYRFRVHQRQPTGAADTGETWVRAAEQWEALSEEEHRIHRELFPEEERLLGEGYDWDHESVYARGVRLDADSTGRVLEDTGGVVYEWVRVPEEVTWRRFPLYASLRAHVPQPQGPEPIRGT